MANKIDNLFPSNNIIGTLSALTVGIVLTDICSGDTNSFWMILSGGIFVSLAAVAAFTRHN